jgi:glycosyltransferase involved in cell wall biosynthesis
MIDQALRRLDERPLEPAAGEILCVCCARNENLRLPYFLDYYRGLGVNRFLVVDNGSTDGSTDVLLAEPDVHVFFTGERYSQSRQGVRWLNALLDAYGTGRWTVTVDVDELLVYPWCEDVGLPDLAAWLTRREEDALLTFLLDMYAAAPLRESRYERGTSFLDACPYFDGDSYIREPDHPAHGRVPVRGGPRARLFWRGGGTPSDPLPPFLPKIPLVKWRQGFAYTASTHVLPGARLAALTGALLHFKLMADFVDRAPEEARRGEHWERAGQYVVYADGLGSRPDLNPVYGGSVRYEDSRQLAALGLATVPDGYPPTASVRAPR